MNLLIRPIFFLMNRMSYRSKFVLLASLFAIPLTLFAGQLAYSLHQEANQAKLTKAGLSYLQIATKLIEDLETLRDLSVITSWQSETPFNNKLEVAKKSVLLQITQLQENPASVKHKGFLAKVGSIINSDSLIRGNEAAGIDGVFEDAHILINQAYSWRTRLSYAFVSRSRNSSNTVDTINLLNENEAYLHALGQARTFGTLYLEQKFVDSYGVSVLEKAYQTLTKLIDQIDIKAEEYRTLINAYPEIKTSKIKQDFINARERLYQELIASLSLTGSSVEYFKHLTEIFESIYQHNRLLFQLSDDLLEQDYQNSLQHLGIFYASVGIMVLLITYVYIGLYSTMNQAVRSLMRSAHKVASGNYNVPIKTNTSDELSSIATAMDSMRLSIQEREDKLTFLGQRDGLTKLYNRQYFDTALDSALANARRHHIPLTVVMLDIDHFKAVNDTYGHQAGDNCLSIISKLLQDQFKRETDIVARYGGEEFIAILDGTTLEEAIIQTEELRKKIEFHHISTGEKTISLTASFGLSALVAPFTASSSKLIALADTLLYQSKHHGRNRISSAYFSEETPTKDNTSLG